MAPLSGHRPHPTRTDRHRQRQLDCCGDICPSLARSLLLSSGHSLDGLRQLQPSCTLLGGINFVAADRLQPVHLLRTPIDGSNRFYCFSVSTWSASLRFVALQRPILASLLQRYLCPQCDVRVHSSQPIAVSGSLCSRRGTGPTRKRSRRKSAGHFLGRGRRHQRAAILASKRTMDNSATGRWCVNRSAPSFE